MKTRVVILIFGWLLLSASPLSFADTLYTKSGESLEGRVVEETEQKIIFEFVGGQIDFDRAEIERIEKKDFSPQKADRPKRVAKKSEKSSWQTWWEDIKSQWSSQNTEKRKRGEKEPSPWVIWGVMIAMNLAQFLLAAATMRLFFRLCSTHVTYGQMLWFQVKLLIVGSIVGLISVFIFGMVIGAMGVKPSTLIHLAGYGVFIVIYAGVYYRMAKRDLDSGFVEAFLLGLVMGLTYFAVGQGFESIGLSYPHPLREYFQVFQGWAGLT